MNTSLVCLTIAAILPYVAKVPVAWAMFKSPGGYDNRHGRIQQETLKGWGHRALAAHRNAFESFPIFAAAVLMANRVEVRAVGWGDTLDVLAVVFVVTRVLYNIFYLADWHLMRSTVWAVGMFATLAIFVIGLS
jgi:uncharacterized MAPEG superfamily protein